MEGYHRPVLLREAIDALAIRDAWYLDCTIGDGGHSIEIIKRGGSVVGVDVDPQALARVQKRFSNEGIQENRFKLVLGNFRDIKNLIKTETKYAGVLFDLGVSSLQLGSPERGFSFMQEGPLDMRMDPALAVKAMDLVNAGGRKELSELFNRLGEEEYSRALAAALVLARQIKPVQTTTELAEIVVKTLGRRGKIHPATRIFQALRIAVNDELAALDKGLNQAIDLIEEKGRMAVISFHSLEDRIVKNKFKQWVREDRGRILTDKPIVPSEEEIKINPRSRSAKLRIFEKYDHY